MVDPARPRVVAPADDRRARRTNRRLDADDPARPRGAPVRGVPALRRNRTTASDTGCSSSGRSGASTTPGFTLAELSALYFSRTLVEASPRRRFSRRTQRVRQARRRADTRDAAVPRSPAARDPGEGRAGRTGRWRDDPSTPARLRASRRRAARAAAQLVDATLHHRRVLMRYHSMSSDREKDYRIEPYRLVFAQGRLLRPRVRTGVRAAAHIRRGSDPVTVASPRNASSRSELPEEAFAHSLGVNQGTPRARRDRVRAAHRALRQGARLASLAAAEEDRTAALTLVLHVCERLGAPKLDSRLRPARARRLTAGARRSRSWRRRTRRELVQYDRRANDAA